MTRRPTTAVLVALALLGACGSPAPDRFDHRDAVVTSVETALGDARTALLAVDAWRAGNATTAYATVVLRESSTGVEGSAAELSGLTPPVSGDALQARAADAIAGAGDAVTAARVAVERHDEEGAAAASRALTEASDGLDRLAEDLG